MRRVAPSTVILNKVPSSELKPSYGNRRMTLGCYAVPFSLALVGSMAAVTLSANLA